MIVPWRCIHKLATMGNDTATAPEIDDGYDLPVYGLNQGHFYSLHVPALICIFLSFASAILTIVLSFRQKSFKTFFSWSKSERLVVYLAICDAAFNLAHSMDHLHILITKKPRVSKRTVSVLWFYVSCLYIGTKSDGERYCCECFCTDFRRQADKVRFERLSSVVMDFWGTNGMRNNSGIGWTAGAKRIFVSGNYDCL